MDYLGKEKDDFLENKLLTQENLKVYLESIEKLANQNLFNISILKNSIECKKIENLIKENNLLKERINVLEMDSLNKHYDDFFFSKTDNKKEVRENKNHDSIFVVTK